MFNNLFGLIKDTIPPIHKEGHIFIFIFFAVTLLLMSFSEILGMIGVILTIWCAYFFRDPVRYVPEGESLLTSPADGMIQLIEKVTPPEELDLGEEKLTRVSVFLNVFDVHINRTPIAGTVTKVHYHPGKFLSANLDKASEENERNSVVVTDKNDVKIAFTQIAGLVARRIVCDVKEGSELQKGERYGLIRFGSRVDIFLPKGVNPQVAVGQRAVGGETIIADLSGKPAAKKVNPI